MEEPVRKKYALHPGRVRSKSDGDMHWIGVGQLARLYELRHDEYVVWDDGNYGRPDGQGSNS